MRRILFAKNKLVEFLVYLNYKRESINVQRVCHQSKLIHRLVH